MTGILLKGGNLDTDTKKGRMSCEDEGGDQGGASISQGTPKTACKPPERGDWNRFSLTASEGTNPAKTLTWDFQPPEL